MNKFFLSFFIIFLLNACIQNNENKSEDTLFIKYQGWWIYGEGLHLFKDEISLNEYFVSFPNEDSTEIIDLYLSIAEMEFYPMEVMIFGNISDDSLIVNNFEILYIQGCDEQ